MIATTNGEVSFADGLCIRPFAMIAELRALMKDQTTIKWRNLSVQGWRQHELGTHGSDYGPFEVEATTWRDDRVEAVFLSHCHAFYDDAPCKDDAERRVFHEGIIVRELKGQREFSWGSVACVLDRSRNRDWLMVVYSPNENMSRNQERTHLILAAHETFLRERKP